MKAIENQISNLLYYDESADNIRENRRLLELTMRIYLKAEWNRIRKENEISIKMFCRKYKEQVAIKDLLNSFESNEQVVKIKSKYYEEIESVKNNKITLCFFTDLIFASGSFTGTSNLRCNAEAIKTTDQIDNSDKFV